MEETKEGVLRNLYSGRALAISLFLILLASATAYANAAVKLTKNVVHDTNALLSASATDVHMIYGQSRDWSDSTSSIFYKKKALSGNTWSVPVKIASNAVSSDYRYYYYYDSSDSADMPKDMSITSNKNKVYIAYVINDGDREIAFKSNKSGSWPKTPKKLTNNTDYNDSQPSIAQSGGNIFVAFRRTPSKVYSDSEIFFTKNVSGTWIKPIALTDNSNYDEQPSVYVKNGKIYVVWVSTSYSRQGWLSSVKYRFWYKGKWSLEKTVTASTTDTFSNPSIAVGSKTYIAYTKTWQWYSTNIGLAYYQSGQWKTQNLTSNPSMAASNSAPKISISNGNLGITWTRLSNQNRDVWYATKKDSETVWKRSNLSNTTTANEYSNDVAIDKDGNGHIVYSSDEDGDSDIYYLRK